MDKFRENNFGIMNLNQESEKLLYLKCVIIVYYVLL